ncbi:cell division protein FtsA [Consotaella salsifontis]|uniref:Cell division protein FtsA n=1 Tax=Consotaella salsifontis TaxID=1365950 RepID=A0A1T4M9C6_9HYPH|nr:cell division protein FtsA [Consotaella salsifontis]SJZ63613.1 cell division protein FtsA [Consotaella salsifontis]
MSPFSRRRSSSLPRLAGLTRRSRTVSVLDVGSSKITCLIARLRPRQESEILPGRTHEIEVVGVGHQRSRGVKSGVVVDLAAAEQSIRHCVDAAERMAGLTIESLIVSLTAGRLKSLKGSGETVAAGETIDSADVKRALGRAAQVPLEDGRLIVHSLPFDMSLDGEAGIENPEGMVGSRFSAHLHVLTAEETPLRNLEAAVNRANLSVEAFVATPYASGLSTLVEDEAAMGSACIDMGSGSTTIAIFQAGRFVYADSIALGGNHITMDLARGLSISPEQAERVKVMHGCALSELMDDTQMIQIAPLGEEGRDVPINVARSLISRIIRPRVEETFELIRDRLAASGLGHVIGKRVVLTGGACQLAGLSDTARAIMQRNVRLGRPLGVAGLSAANKSPAFATSVGLLIYPQVAASERFADSAAAGLVFDDRSRLGRFGTWLRHSF